MAPLFFSCDNTPKDADEQATGSEESIEQKKDEELGPDEGTDTMRLKE